MNKIACAFVALVLFSGCENSVPSKRTTEQIFDSVDKAVAASKNDTVGKIEYELYKSYRLGKNWYSVVANKIQPSIGDFKNNCKYIIRSVHREINSDSIVVDVYDDDKARVLYTETSHERPLTKKELVYVNSHLMAIWSGKLLASTPDDEFEMEYLPSSYDTPLFQYHSRERYKPW